MFAVAVIFGVLAGCVVVPSGPRPVVGPTAIVIDDTGAPPVEYVVEGRPVYYAVEPGVAYYPVFLGFPGSCFCIMPIRFVGGVWYAPGRVVVHQGRFPLYHPAPHHLNTWRGNHGVFRGHVPEHGRMERGPSGRMHVVPPARHARPPQVVPRHDVTPRTAPPHRGQPRVQQHQQQQPRQAQPQVKPQPRQAQPQVRQSPQVRPQQQQKAPAKAPAKKCQPNQQC